MVAIALAAALSPATAGSPWGGGVFDPRRFHLAASNATAAAGVWVFRGNEPIEVDRESGRRVFAYETLMRLMHERAPEMPKDVWLVDLSFLDAEWEDARVERDFFISGTVRGRVMRWPLLGALPVDPAHFHNSTRVRMAQSDVWAVDRLPERVQEIRALLRGDHDARERMGGAGLPLAVYGHCEAGCDRTGEFMAALYMSAAGMTVEEAWERDARECGRPPNTLAEPAIKWFCLWMQYWATPPRGEEVGGERGCIQDLPRGG